MRRASLWRLLSLCSARKSFRFPRSFCGVPRRFRRSAAWRRPSRNANLAALPLARLTRVRLPSRSVAMAMSGWLVGMSVDPSTVHSCDSSEPLLTPRVSMVPSARMARSLAGLIMRQLPDSPVMLQSCCGVSGRFSLRATVVEPFFDYVLGVGLQHNFIVLVLVESHFCCAPAGKPCCYDEAEGCQHGAEKMV